jgi:hypothetical protein
MNPSEAKVEFSPDLMVGRHYTPYGILSILSGGLF